MPSDRLQRMKKTHNELIKISQAWAGKWGYDPERARELRTQAILINHAHYLETIPMYRKLADEAGISELEDTGPIKHELMSTDDIFKSYNQEWLDNRDFGRMNEWLGSIFSEDVDINTDGVSTIDEWIDRLTAGGIVPAYSSGTTGRFSFVPRCEYAWRLFTTAPICYLTPLLMEMKIGSWWQRLAIKPVAKLLSPDAFAGILSRFGLPDYDGIFLNFRKGNMGIQLVGQEFSKIFPRSYFLYDIDLSASALRCITRGAQNEEDQKILDEFKAATIGRKDENYQRVIGHIKQSTANGQKVFLFGAPYQLKELCELMSGRREKVPLKDNSFIMFGGGWKSFEGDKIEREVLVGMIQEIFDVPDELIVEGYSMTEINGVMPRCEYGRFHMPPIVEPVVLDEDLVPLEGSDLSGAFGFLDPFAVSYPGFIITGDNVRMVEETCECGLTGPAILEIARAPGREVKGCGGIMASVKA